MHNLIIKKPKGLGN